MASRGPRRFSPGAIAFSAIGLVVVVVLVVVLVAVVGGGGNGNVPAAKTRTPAPMGVVNNEVVAAWAKDAAAVGVPSSSTVAAPTVEKSQPKLTAPGSSLPAVAFVGAEFCPYCAAERWAIVMAMGQFGHFTFLNQTESSSIDVYPETVTFSFYQKQYSSRYLTFDTVEATTNQPQGTTGYVPLQPIPSWIQKPYVQYDNAAGYPFLDIDNKFIVKSPSYVPSVLTGLTFDEIAGKLSNASDPVTQAIVGTANYLVASVCNVDGAQPASVCSNPAVAKAQSAMGVK